MLAAPFQTALVLSGPTGSGKTALALELAPRLNAEIVAMDSMTLYRGMDIGTAKPTPAERGRLPHHLIDVLDPWESASVAWWLEQARRACAEIESRGKQVLFVGGTPLYLKTLMAGLFEGPPADSLLRQRLTEEAQRHGSEVLHQRLAQVDPTSAGRLHVNDTRRLIRALEVFELTGKPLSAWQTQWREDGVAALTQPAQEGNAVPRILWLDVPRPLLYERINQRVEGMFGQGLVNEVRALAEGPRGMSQQARQALGYKEVLDHLDGMTGLKETIGRVQTRTRNFAKRQITWFRHLPGIVPATSELTQALWGSKMLYGHS